MQMRFCQCLKYFHICFINKVTSFVSCWTVCLIINTLINTSYWICWRSCHWIPKISSSSSHWHIITRDQFSMQIKIDIHSLWAISCGLQEKLSAALRTFSCTKTSRVTEGHLKDQMLHSVEQWALRLLQAKWASFKHCTWFLSREAPVPLNQHLILDGAPPSAGTSW